MLAPGSVSIITICPGCRITCMHGYNRNLILPSPATLCGLARQIKDASSELNSKAYLWQKISGAGLDLDVVQLYTVVLNFVFILSLYLFCDRCIVYLCIKRCI